MDPLKDLDSVDLQMQFVNDVLGKLHALFRSCLDFQSISPQLRSHKLLTSNEWEVISKKDGREQQVDEFLKCLPHKGRNCLSLLINCLQSSPEHAGHQDILVELKKLVEKQTETDNPAADILENMNDPQDSESAQSEFEKVLSKFTSTISSLHLNETKSLKQKIEQQNVEIKKLQSHCTDYTAVIQQLEETISALKNDNETLRTQLQEKEELLKSPSVTEVSIDFESCEEETTHEKLISSQSCSYSSPPDSALHKPVKRSYSESPNQHPEVHLLSLSLEDRMKAYREKSKMYHIKWQSLCVDKEVLKKEKCELEWEVTRLREQLDTVSIASHTSVLSHHHRSLSYSCSSLNEKDLDASKFYYSSLNEKDLDQAKARCTSDKQTVEGSNTSYLSRKIASFIKKTPVKRTTRHRSSSPELQAVNSEISDTLPEDTSEDYLNPIYQGWLTKEGGHKKMLRKRWCILSSHCFFYFEKEEDLKKPLGILYLTPDMEVTDSAKENNWFMISNKSNTNMNSCKLDKSKGGYIRGNHASYNLQASCDDDKKKWIEAFQKVFETLRTLT